MEYLMDGLSVNWKVLSEFKKETEEAGLYKLINIRSCNLHVVHGALQSVTESTSWNFKNIMTGTYQVLKDSAHCGDCISITGSTVFPLQFCPTQWVNFSDSRGIDQLGLDSIMVVFSTILLDISLTFTFFFLYDPLKPIKSSVPKSWSICDNPHSWRTPWNTAIM